MGEWICILYTGINFKIIFKFKYRVQNEDKIINEPEGQNEPSEDYFMFNLED